MQRRRVFSILLVVMLTVTIIYPMNKNVQIRANDNGAKTHILSNPTKDTTGNTIWDCVYFGNYYQNDVEGKYKEPIKWRVLKVDGNDAFLLADKGLDVKPWHESGDGVDWETCTLRSWLNGYKGSMNKNGIDYSNDNFMDTAFTAEEQQAINTTLVSNAQDPFFDSPKVNDTYDQVYCLAYKEALNTEYGFSGEYNVDPTRALVVTPYANAKLDWETYPWLMPGWWLRTMGDDKYRDVNTYKGKYAAYVFQSGFVYPNGSSVNDTFMTVRPVLHLNTQNTDVYSYAGKVSSDGTESDVPTTQEVTTPNETTTQEGIETSPEATTTPNIETTKESTTPENLPLTPGQADADLWFEIGGYTYYCGPWNGSTVQLGADPEDPDHVQMQQLTSNFGSAWGLQLKKTVTGLVPGKIYTISIDMYSPSEDGSYKITNDLNESEPRKLVIGTTTLSTELMADGDGTIEFVVGAGFVGTSVVLDFSNVVVKDEDGNIVYPKAEEQTTKMEENTTVVEDDTTTVAAPTTVAPTTVVPTTVAPTTVAPTTVAPTTVAPTTVVPTTAVEDDTIPAPIGLTYAGNETLPYYFAWQAPASDIESYNVYVDGRLVAASNITAINLTADAFANGNGDYVVSVKSVRNGKESKATSITYAYTGGTVDKPTTVAPTTTVAATTVAPTTVAPTTIVTPTTVAPTTVAPTTVAPTTTVVPTTVAPTTEAPTTEAPTTVAPTTEASTTMAPTTQSETSTVAIGEGSNAGKVDSEILNCKNDKDLAGSTFGKLRVKVKKSKKKAISLKWKNIQVAKTYVIYGAKCGTSYKKIATVHSKTFADKKLRKGTYYKYMVVALNEKDKVVAVSKLIHVATKGGKVGNCKKLKVNKSKVNLKQGRKFKLKVKQIAESKKVKLKKHRKIAFESDNQDVAVVSKKGVITAKKKGKCSVYVYAQNGVYKQVKVTVK